MTGRTKGIALVAAQGGASTSTYVDSAAVALFAVKTEDPAILAIMWVAAAQKTAVSAKAEIWRQFERRVSSS